MVTEVRVSWTILLSTCFRNDPLDPLMEEISSLRTLCVEATEVAGDAAWEARKCIPEGGTILRSNQGDRWCRAISRRSGFMISTPLHEKNAF
jgi:hypothetical protein